MTKYKITFRADNGKELIKVYTLTESELNKAYFRKKHQHKTIGDFIITDITPTHEA